MDTIKLIREIEKRIEKAEEYLPVVIEMLQKNEGIKFTHRIKGKEQILEKIRLFAGKQYYQGMDEIQILDSIGDIIGLTVIADDFTDAYLMLGKINDNFKMEKQQIKVERLVDYISKASNTNYRCLLEQLYPEEGIPFEIQITDEENLKIREETHEEFKRIKYKQVRNVPEEQKADNEGRE